MIRNYNILALGHHDITKNKWLEELNQTRIKVNILQNAGPDKDTNNFFQYMDLKNIPYNELEKNNAIIFYCDNEFAPQILYLLDTLKIINRIPLIAFVDSDNIRNYIPFIDKFSILFTQNRSIYSFLAQKVNTENQTLIMSWPWLFKPNYQGYEETEKQIKFVYEASNIETFDRMLSKMLTLSVNLASHSNISFGIFINEDLKTQFGNLLLPMPGIGNFSYIDKYENYQTTHIIELLDNYYSDIDIKYLEYKINNHLVLVNEKHLLFTPDSETMCDFNNMDSLIKHILNISNNIIGNKKLLTDLENKWRLSDISIHGVTDYIQQIINAQPAPYTDYRLDKGPLRV